jgi:hypothetical protein
MRIGERTSLREGGGMEHRAMWIGPLLLSLALVVGGRSSTPKPAGR